MYAGANPITNVPKLISKPEFQHNIPSSATNGAPANSRDLEANLPHVLRIYTPEQDRAHSLGHSGVQLIDDNLNPTMERKRYKEILFRELTWMARYARCRTRGNSTLQRSCEDNTPLTMIGT